MPIDRSSGYIYGAIATDISDAIFAGTLKPGDKIPSRNELAATYGCALETVARAMGVLRAEGLIESVQRGGSYVVRPKPLIHRYGTRRYLRLERPVGKRPTQAEAEREGQNSDQLVLSVEQVIPPPEVALGLGIDDADEALVRRHLITANIVPDTSVPIALIDSYYRLSFVEGTDLTKPIVIEGGVDRYLADELGVVFGFFTEELRAREPSPHEAAMLSLREGEPVIALLRTMLCEKERVIQVSDQRLAGDRYVLLYDVPAG